MKQQDLLESLNGESDVSLSAKEILSRMIVYNALGVDSSISVDSSLESCTGIKPSAALLATCGTLDLSTLSKSYAVLLIIRKFLIKGGCPFCNRRMSEINEWRKSLLQLGIVPVILHSETAPDANLFFKEICNPQLRDIWRVSDPFYKNTTQLCKAPDSGTTPLQFIPYDKLYPIKKITKLVPVLTQGYFDPANRYKSDKDLEFEQSALEVDARILLIKNDKVVKTWNHQKHDHAPDVLGDVIIELDWLTREFMEGIKSELNEEEIDNNDNTSEFEIEIDKEEEEEPSTPTRVNNKSIEEIEPLSPSSSTRQLKSILDTLQINIDVYKKEHARKFQFQKITKLENVKELQEKTEKAKKKFKDFKASQTSCLPVILPSGTSNFVQEMSLEDLGQSMGSLTKLIESERMRKYLKLFCVREYNAESILFWEDVNLLYKKLFRGRISKEKIVQHSNRIATRYLLDENSLFLLNTTTRLKQQVEESLPKIAKLKTKQDLEKAETLFDCVMADMMAHTLADVYVRFIFSTEYKQMKIDLGLVSNN